MRRKRLHDIGVLLLLLLLLWPFHSIRRMRMHLHGVVALIPSALLLTPHARGWLVWKWRLLLLLLLLLLFRYG